MSAVRGRSRRAQRGLASVEMALATPALLVLMLVAAEFTRVFYEFNTLTKSVRDAARYAAIEALDDTGLNLGGKVAEAKNLAVTGRLTGGEPLLDGLSAADIDIQVVNLGSGTIQRPYIEVTGGYTFQPLAPVIGAMSFLSADVSMAFRLQARSTMRAQR